MEIQIIIIVKIVKLNNIDYYVLNDKNKFFNWIYPTYEDTSYKYIENEKLNFFNETQGQLFAKQFLVDSPYRGILLYHGLGTGKICAALITSENIILKKHVLLFIPASLRQNWIDELSFCGNPIYKTKEHIFKNYTFINYNSSGVKDVYLNIKNNIYLDSHVNFSKNGTSYSGVVTKIIDGKFTYKQYKPNNIEVTVDNTEEIIQCSILNDNVVLTDNTNPFDNKIIIFDEVHNFIVTLSNILRTIKKPSYIQKIKLGAKLIASWLIPSIKHPSPAKTYVLWLIIFYQVFFLKISSTIAKPTEFAIPCPSGPVVVSIPVPG